MEILKGALFALMAVRASKYKNMLTKRQIFNFDFLFDEI